MQNRNHITKDETMTSLNFATTSRPSATKINFFQRFSFCMKVQKERSTLSELSDEQLKDIGITPDQAQKEAARPAWDIPENWCQRR